MAATPSYDGDPPRPRGLSRGRKPPGFTTFSPAPKRTTALASKGTPARPTAPAPQSTRPAASLDSHRTRRNHPALQAAKAKSDDDKPNVTSSSSNSAIQPLKIPAHVRNLLSSPSSHPSSPNRSMSRLDLIVKSEPSKARRPAPQPPTLGSRLRRATVSSPGLPHDNAEKISAILGRPLLRTEEQRTNVYNPTDVAEVLTPLVGTPLTPRRFAHVPPARTKRLASPRPHHHAQQQRLSARFLRSAPASSPTPVHPLHPEHAALVERQVNTPPETSVNKENVSLKPPEDAQPIESKHVIAPVDLAANNTPDTSSAHNVQDGASTCSTALRCTTDAYVGTPRIELMSCGTQTEVLSLVEVEPQQDEMAPKEEILVPEDSTSATSAQLEPHESERETPPQPEPPLKLQQESELDEVLGDGLGCPHASSHHSMQPPSGSCGEGLCVTQYLEPRYDDDGTSSASGLAEQRVLARESPALLKYQPQHSDGALVTKVPAMLDLHQGQHEEFCGNTNQEPYKTGFSGVEDFCSLNFVNSSSSSDSEEGGNNDGVNRTSVDIVATEESSSEQILDLHRAEFSFLPSSEKLLASVEDFEIVSPILEEESVQKLGREERLCHSGSLDSSLRKRIRKPFSLTEGVCRAANPRRSSPERRPPSSDLHTQPCQTGGAVAAEDKPGDVGSRLPSSPDHVAEVGDEGEARGDASDSYPEHVDSSHQPLSASIEPDRHQRRRRLFLPLILVVASAVFYYCSMFVSK